MSEPVTTNPKDGKRDGFNNDPWDHPRWSSLSTMPPIAQRKHQTPQPSNRSTGPLKAAFEGNRSKPANPEIAILLKTPLVMNRPRPITGSSLLSMAPPIKSRTSSSMALIGPAIDTPPGRIACVPKIIPYPVWLSSVTSTISTASYPGRKHQRWSIQYGHFPIDSEQIPVSKITAAPVVHQDCLITNTRQGYARRDQTAHIDSSRSFNAISSLSLGQSTNQPVAVVTWVTLSSDACVSSFSESTESPGVSTSSC